jgi:cytochrome c oxidase cbb3-type subunit 3
MPQPTTLPLNRASAVRHTWVWVIVAIVLVIAATLIWSGHLRRDRLQFRLLATDANAVVRDRQLTDFAIRQAIPLYKANCAVCHGLDMTGNTALGAPNLKDRVWLYGSGTVFDIERTLLYGVRAGRGKTHNVTEMPAFGLAGVLGPTEIRNVVQYVLQLSHRPHRADAATEGRKVYFGVANCSDCHGSDGRGNSDYGAPDLTANVWNSGGDEQALYNTIYFGRHRVMPAWIGTLSLWQIRALAVYVYSASHPH